MLLPPTMVVYVKKSDRGGGGRGEGGGRCNVGGLLLGAAAPVFVQTADVLDLVSQ